MLKRTQSLVLGVSGIGMLLAVCMAISNRATSADGVSRDGQKAAVGTLPAPGTYKVDPVHSFVYFSAWHHIVGVVRGRFEQTTGTLTVSQDPAVCAVDITIDTWSVNTQYTERDDEGHITARRIVVPRLLA